MLIKINDNLYIDPADVSIMFADEKKNRYMVKCKNDSVAWFVPLEYRLAIRDKMDVYLKMQTDYRGFPIGGMPSMIVNNG